VASINDNRGKIRVHDVRESARREQNDTPNTVAQNKSQRFD
jgi:hypothetical protein